MPSTKIIFTGTGQIFKNETSLKLKELVIESQGSNNLISSSNVCSCLTLENCIINESVNVSIDGCDSVIYINSTINTDNIIDFTSVNRLTFNNTSINLDINPDNVNGFTSLCNINKSDVYTFNVNMNAYFYGVEDIDINFFSFYDSFAKKVDINYSGFYYIVSPSTMIIADSTTCNVI